MLRHDARTALTRAREEVDRPGVDPESVEYQHWLLVKGAAQVPNDRLEAWAKTAPKKALIVAYCT